MRQNYGVGPIRFSDCRTTGLVQFDSLTVDSYQRLHALKYRYIGIGGDRNESSYRMSDANRKCGWNKEEHSNSSSRIGMGGGSRST